MHVLTTRMRYGTPLVWIGAEDRGNRVQITVTPWVGIPCASVLLRALRRRGQRGDAGECDEAFQCRCFAQLCQDRGLDRRLSGGDLAMLHNERRWPPRSGATPMSNFGLYYVVIGPAAMLAIGAIVFWLITRLPD